MYLKKTWILILKIKNIIFLLAGLVFMFIGMADISSLSAYYWGDWNTVYNARSTPGSLGLIVLSLALFIVAALSNNAIKRAGFYSTYFEGILYNKITYDEIAEVSGLSRNYVYFELYLFRLIYMKNYSFNKDETGEYIEPYSKRISCSCRNCGAVIDKMQYHTGYCPYCKTPDVFATVISDKKVYSISNEFSKGSWDKTAYICQSFRAKFFAYIIAFTIVLCLIFMLICMLIDYSGKINNTDYLRDQLMSGTSYYSFELIQKDMKNTMIWVGFFVGMLIPILVLTFNRVRLLIIADDFAKKLVFASSPYIDITDRRFSVRSPLSTIKRMRKVLQVRYMRNCSIEKHNGALTIAVARRIVKDKCPTCSAPIVGAVDENYVCQFCKNKIINVIVKN